MTFPDERPARRAILSGLLRATVPPTPDHTHPPSLADAFRYIRTLALIGVPFGLFLGLFSRPYWQGVLVNYLFSFAIGLSVGGFVRLADWAVCRWAGGRPKGKALRNHIALMFVAGVAGSQLPLFIASRVIPGLRMYNNWRSTMLSVGFSVIFTTLFMGIIYARVFYRRLVEREAAEQTARAELARAELKALRARIHPHFLFNTLNTIAALIPSEPEVAERVTTRLAEVFRFVLRGSERESVPLAEELDFVRAYLEIERARFGDMLRVVEEIEPAALDVQVPALLLQPLVENAVRHGLASRRDGGRVCVAAALAEGMLTLRVEDDGVGFDPVAVEARRGNGGFGLRSAAERLQALGDGARLSIDARPGGGTRIAVTLPVRRAD